MFSSSTKIQLVVVLAALGSSVTASDLDARASTLTLPGIFKNATAQVTSLRQQLQRAIDFNSTLKAEPAYVQSVLSQVDAVIGSTAAQINQIGKLPFDQVSGGLTESEIQYGSTEFLTAVAVTLIAPQSVADKYPEIQKSIDTIQLSICPRNWLCVWYPWLCWIWWPWVLFASATFKSLSVKIAP